MGHLNIPKLFSNEASLLRDARKRCIDIHGSDIRAAGNEVEIAVRHWMNRMLPNTVSVGHGHIIDQASNISPQLDCIIRDRSHVPTLFTSADGTEYTPFDSIYAIGEIKSTYNKSAKYIQAFAKIIKSINRSLFRNLVTNTAYSGITPNTLLHHIIQESSQPYLNQLFSFMLFVDAGDATVEDIEEIYRSIPDANLPDLVVFLNGCVIIKGAIKEGAIQVHKYSKYAPADFKWQIIPAPQIENKDVTSEGKNLGFLYYCLLNHIRDSLLPGPNLNLYMKDLMFGLKSTIISVTPLREVTGVSVTDQT